MAIKKGIYAASMSIFNQDLSLDIDSTIKHSEKIIDSGCHGVVIFGSTGQSQLISLAEKKRLIEKLLGKFFFHQKTPELDFSLFFLVQQHDTYY